MRRPPPSPSLTPAKSCATIFGRATSWAFCRSSISCAASSGRTAGAGRRFRPRSYSTTPICTGRSTDTSISPAWPGMPATTGTTPSSPRFRSTDSTSIPRRRRCFAPLPTGSRSPFTATTTPAGSWSRVDRAGARRLGADALRRVAAFERRSGLRVAPIMIPPHERAAEAALAGLLDAGFLGISAAPSIAMPVGALSPARAVGDWGAGAVSRRRVPALCSPAALGGRRRSGVPCVPRSPADPLRPPRRCREWS